MLVVPVFQRTGFIYSLHGDRINRERGKDMKRVILMLLVVLLVVGTVVTQSVAADFPRKGQPVTMIIPWAAGASSDLGGRMLAMGMEKVLGVPVMVVNKPGASGQLGMTELAQSKPDGHTIAYSALSSVIMNYVDPGRKATFQRQDLMSVGAHVADVRAVAVNARSPYKTLKDLLDAAKANPGKIKGGTNGALTDVHLAQLWLEKLSGAKFAYVHFKGGGETIPALLGNHVDTYIGSSSELARFVKSGEFRVLAVLSEKENKFLPGVRTAKSQGFPVFFTTYRNVYAPKGTSKEVVETLSKAMRTVMESDEHKKKLEGEMSLVLDYQNPAEMDNSWDLLENAMKELMPLARN
jgi:tripartite-type tricarboxylate transporter receptor subunit TctC